MAESRGTTRISKALSNVSVEFKNMLNIWNRVLPAVPVDKRTDTYYIFGAENKRHHGKIRANGDPSVKVRSLTASTDTYNCKKHSYNDIITDDDRDDQDPIINLDTRITQRVTDIVDMDIEQDAANTVFNATNYPGLTGNPAKKWDYDEALSTPLQDVDEKRRLISSYIGVKPNIMVVGAKVHDQLKRHPQLVDQLKYTQSITFLNEKQLAAIFDVQQYIVGENTYITSKPGQTETFDFIWGNFCSLLYIPLGPKKDEPSWGYTFLHKLHGGLTAKTKKWRNEDNEGDIIEVTRSYDQKVTGKKAGYLFTNVVTV